MPKYIDTISKAEIIGTFMDTIRDISDEKETIKELHKCYDKLNALPTADTVEVVRCKDCRHLEVLNGDTYYARCKWHGRLFGSFGRADTRIWFCADGERRDDGETGVDV